MKKLLKIILILILIWFVVAVFAAWFFIHKIGDLRPALLPPSNFTTAQNPVQSSGSPNTANQAAVKSAGPLQVPLGFQIEVLTDKVPDARDLQITPGGNLLVSSMKQGKVFFISLSQQSASPKVILSNLNNPHGLAFYNGKLFVAEETKVSRYAWNEEQLSAIFEKKLIDLPGANGGLHHSRSLVFDKTGKLYITLGSTCNVCVEKNPWNAAVITTDQEGSNPQLFSKGLRNSVFLTLNPDSNQVWATEMGRDYLGDNLPPDEINILQSNQDYGWPYCYGNKVYDQNFAKESSAYCQNIVAPIFEIPAHSAPLGLSFITSTQFPSDWKGDLLVAYHGSWNSTVPTGYKIVHLKRSGDQLTSAEDFVTGFLSGNQAYGRPVDLTFDAAGNLYISDDKAGRVYKVTKSQN